jgi:hypothetical protein
MTCKQGDCTRPPQTRGYCESHYRKRLRMGLFGWRDVTQVRAHLTALRDLGWTWEQIAETADVSTYVPHQIGVGRTKRIRAENEQALLSLPLEPRDSHRGINSAGTRRRVQALAWMGWPMHEVARRADTPASTLRTLILPSRRVSITLARRVAAVYDDLSLKPGPSRIAAAKARQLGFAPPLAWDDETISDPRARPHGIRRDEQVAV